MSARSPQGCDSASFARPSALRQILIDFANVTPDNHIGYHRGHRVYYEVIGYTKMLQDAVKRNRIFFDKLNLVDNRWQIE